MKHENILKGVGNNQFSNQFENPGPGFITLPILLTFQGG